MTKISGTWVITFAFISVLSIVIGLLKTKHNDTNSENILPNPPNHSGAIPSIPEVKVRRDVFVVHQSFYYFDTGKKLDPELLGEKIGLVKRIGVFERVENVDSLTFQPGCPIYTIKDENLKDKIALGVLLGKEGSGPISHFVILEKGPSISEGSIHQDGRYYR
ncbi:hypothetical protein [Paenibacillus oceani]|uniref:Uncharacterized protein n=1 Tax=Paenibacillus oceani TaxID=2772510 RepID=A0A927CB02_9BACL|nr:hypothetical protein [Paenibacillus oceani]MBD2862691.1 hypothetical protein [Paenibacillus oceani]